MSVQVQRDAMEDESKAVLIKKWFATWGRNQSRPLSLSPNEIILLVTTNFVLQVPESLSCRCGGLLDYPRFMDETDLFN